MGATVSYMSVSVNGFIAGPNVRPDNGLGDGGERLQSSRAAGRSSRPAAGVVTTTTASRSSSTVSGRPASTSPAGRWSATTPMSRRRSTGARAAAGDRTVLVLLGRGRRLFDDLPAGQLQLERTRVLPGEDGVTHLHYRVRRG